MLSFFRILISLKWVSSLPSVHARIWFKILAWQFMLLTPGKMELLILIKTNYSIVWVYNYFWRPAISRILSAFCFKFSDDSAVCLPTSSFNTLLSQWVISENSPAIVWCTDLCLTMGAAAWAAAIYQAWHLF